MLDSDLEIMNQSFFENTEIFMALLVKDSERQLVTENELVGRQEVDHNIQEFGVPRFIDHVAPNVLVFNDINMVLSSIDIDESFALYLVVEPPYLFLNIHIKLLPQKWNLLGLLGDKNIVIEVTDGVQSYICYLLNLINERSVFFNC